MKIILLENVRKVGSIGDVIDVKRGFARNYLISQKKALFASKQNSSSLLVNTRGLISIKFASFSIKTL